MADPKTGKNGGVPRLVFSTDQLPAELDDRARFKHWRETEAQVFGLLDVEYAFDRPFQARVEVAQVGAVGLVRLAGAFNRVQRTARGIAADGHDGFVLGLNWGPGLICHSQRSRDALLAPGAASLIYEAEAGNARLAPGTDMFMLSLPRRPLLDRVANAEDLMARPVDSRQSALRHLRCYLDILLGPDGPDDDPLLAAHIETTLLDLIALTLGAGREAAEVAAMRGLRAARLRRVLAEIKAGFSNPGFSARDVAARLNLSPRYIRELLHETGTGFAERVMELRLQKARAMLASPQYRDIYVSQIAFTCGFTQASTFNHAFRRRFGMTPNTARNGARLV